MPLLHRDDSRVSPVPEHQASGAQCPERRVNTALFKGLPWEHKTGRAVLLGEWYLDLRKLWHLGGSSDPGA